ncbi:MAG: hypothetical protein ACK56F_28150, partial [bacterium]
YDLVRPHPLKISPIQLDLQEGGHTYIPEEQLQMLKLTTKVASYHPGDTPICQPVKLGLQ